MKFYVDDPNLELKLYQARVIGNNIRRYRLKAGLTKDALGSKVDPPVTGRMVTNWESGRCSPTLFTAISLTHLLGCSYDDIYRIKGDKLL